MDYLKEDGSNTRRRSTRQTSKTALYSADLKPRAPLKRTRKMREDDEESTAVNASEAKSLDKGDDGASPDKIPKLEKAKKAADLNERGDECNHTDVEMDEDEDEEDKDQEMGSDEEAEQDHRTSLKAPSGTTQNACRQGEIEKSTIMLSRRSSIRLKTADLEIPQKTENYRQKAKLQDPSSLGAATLENHQEAVRRRTRSNNAYQNRIANKDSPSVVSWNRYTPSHPQKSHVYTTLKPPIPGQITYHTNTEMKTLQKPDTLKPKATSSRGWKFEFSSWFLKLTALLLLVCLLACLRFRFSNQPQTRMDHSETVEKFDQDVSALHRLFPSQRSVIWKRSRAHLKHHLDTVYPTEPVSLILTAGLQAEKTLGCLAKHLASAYSTFHNTSFLEINGAAKRAKDSDQVKLEIDEALKAAFEGDKCAAVVHHFEELPPGSTLIFYRYCDHENAAFKKVFLVFTVMLSVDEIDPKTSLSAVEDMVYDHLKEKFISSERSAMFNEMDVDKMSGLWSRISHLILPVAAEEKIERQGCGHD